MRGEEMKMIAKAKQSNAEQNKNQNWDWSKARTRTQSKIKTFVLVVLQCLPILWKFCNQIPMAFKVKFPGGSQSLCLIPMLGNLLGALELSQQCENFFGIIDLRFVGYLLSSSIVQLVATSSKRTFPQATPPRTSTVRGPLLATGHCWPMPPQETFKCSQADLAQSLWGSLLLFLSPVAPKVLFAPSESLWRVWDLILKEIVTLIQSCCSFSLALGPGVSFFGSIQHSPFSYCSYCSWGSQGKNTEVICYSLLQW